ncbi:MAG TPA: ATP synthase F1 subunit delta [Bacillota bacterium]|nr:ATP synthase F1 subunit delta [Bacillota bacterium]HPJ86262.1 ATP synthase F1 subunit delta [Bacillota bacterium]HPQ62401.1 ATP synthase F1 subunit delta [Bacillota bacterium]HRX91964.1 ATP synthase F1 subunit delta [Candidatus Izemoplasmatales bacterium]
MKGLREEYAEAIFQLALERNVLKETEDGLEAFTKGLDDKSLRFFDHPHISKQEKKTVIEKAVRSPLLKDFLCVLVDNNRMGLVFEIKTAFDEFVNEHNLVKPVKVFTAKPLSADQKKNLADKLGKNYNRKIAITEIIDDKIISGIKIAVDDRIIDYTSNRQLEELQLKMKKDER